VRKTAARLQSRAAQTHPVLVDHNPMRGHSPSMPFSARLNGLIRRITFLCHELRIAIP
jgi:hypothetical protein